MESRKGGRTLLRLSASLGFRSFRIRLRKSDTLSLLYSNLFLFLFSPVLLPSYLLHRDPCLLVVTQFQSFLYISFVLITMASRLPLARFSGQRLIPLTRSTRAPVQLRGIKGLSTFTGSKTVPNASGLLRVSSG